MSNEIEYTYVKGKGWTVSDVESYSVVVGRYRITGYVRKPLPGEHFWVGSLITGLEYMRRSSYWNQILSDPEFSMTSQFLKCGPTGTGFSDEATYCTLICEKL